MSSHASRRDEREEGGSEKRRAASPRPRDSDVDRRERSRGRESRSDEDIDDDSRRRRRDRDESRQDRSSPRRDDHRSDRHRRRSRSRSRSRSRDRRRDGDADSDQSSDRSRSRRRRRHSSRSPSKRERSRHHSSRRRRSPSRSRSSDDSGDRRHRRHGRDRYERDDAHSRPSDGRTNASAAAAAAPPRAAAVAAAPDASTGNRAERIAAMFGYTAENNPFGDPTLTKGFVWRAKIEKDLRTGVRDRAPTKADIEASRDALMDDVERARIRRQQRDAQREEFERLKAEEARLREAEQNKDWERKEEEFNLKQTRARSFVRIRDGRERPVDVLAKNQLFIDAVERPNPLGGDSIAGFVLDAELIDPLDLIDVLGTAHLRSLRNDVGAYVELETRSDKSSRTARYWQALALVCDDALDRAELAAADMARESGQAGSSAAAMVHSEVAAMFVGMQEAELADMDRTVRDTIRQGIEQRRSGADGAFASRGESIVDVEYWERVQRQLHVAQARLAARRLSRELLLHRLEQVKAAALDSGAMGRHATSTRAPRATDDPVDELVTELRDAGILPSQTAVDARMRGIALVPTSAPVQRKPEDDDTFVDEHGRVLPLGSLESALPVDSEVVLPADAAAAAERAYTGEDATKMDADALEDKYRPRKPRYFNRVKTGYDWNMYNKTHYDHDNPPPKTVQGYKFNIFYPDLLDKSHTPTYKLEPADTDDFCIIRFRAGPPYEDVAFKIVNREWEYQRKHGFRFVYDRGVLQLYFNFKRQRYRK